MMSGLDFLNLVNKMQLLNTPGLVCSPEFWQADLQNASAHISGLVSPRLHKGRSLGPAGQPCPSLVLFYVRTLQKAGTAPQNVSPHA